MSNTPNQILLSRARDGDQDALGDLLRGHKRMLERMARREIGDRLQARLSAADLLQQTCLSAIRNFDDFEGENEPQFVAWLRGVHERNVKDAIREHVRAKKRAVSAEQLPGTNVRQDTPAHTASEQAMLGESKAELIQAIATLPDDQAQAIRLRHLEQLSLNEMSLQMDRSEVAVASLLKRGLASLRERLRTDS